MRARNRRGGVVLLDVLVALGVFAIAAVATIALVQESARAVTAAIATDVDVMRASAFLDVVSLWSDEDLDRRLGRRIQGHWEMYVEKSGSIYRIVLSDSGGRTLLTTALYRRTQNPTTQDAR